MHFLGNRLRPGEEGGTGYAKHDPQGDLPLLLTHAGDSTFFEEFRHGERVLYLGIVIDKEVCLKTLLSPPLDSQRNDRQGIFLPPDHGR
jgi:hypothetical protein